MSVAVRLPNLGVERQPLRVSCWLVEPGESVDAGERIVEVLAPGVTFDVAAPCDGTLLRIVKPIDAALTAGDVLGWIEPDAPDDEDSSD